MNASQIHLALNHAPLFFSITGGLILLYGFIRKNDSVKILSPYFLIAAALITVPVYLTGSGAEEIVEKLPGVSEGMIEEHEEMAKIGLIVIIITGVAALASLLVKQKTALLKTGLILCTILSFVSFGVMAQTAHLGGQIRHAEIRNRAAVPDDNKIEEEKKDIKEKDDDD